MRVVSDARGRPALELKPGDDPRKAAARPPAPELTRLWREGWRVYGLEQPRVTVRDLRQRLEQRARQALAEAAEPILVPVGEAAKVLGESERTLRWQIQAGTREATYMQDGRLAVEIPRRRAVVVPFVARQRVDPRALAAAARACVRPGQQFGGYRRRRDGRAWDRAEKLAR